MRQKPAIGIQSFEKIITENCFYVDKTDFIREWWESKDEVTLITRPRRFGKTLNMSMLECFFSNQYQGRGDLFEGLSIWESEEYRELQGSLPVIALSFATVKGDDFELAQKMIFRIMSTLYEKYDFLLESDKLSTANKAAFRKISEADGELDASQAATALQALSSYLEKHYGKKPLIFLDEYDTPMQVAYVGGYWREMIGFITPMFLSTFKTNRSMERALLMGLCEESTFTNLNNLRVVTTTSNRYMTAFGFTEEEAFASLDAHGMGDQKEEAKRWYGGFVFGTVKDIYNPWSIQNLIEKKECALYWDDINYNSLAEKLIRRNASYIKMNMETLLAGEGIKAEIDETIDFYQMDGNVDAIWSLLLANGYLKVENVEFIENMLKWEYFLSLTNFEARIMFEGMIETWF